MIFSWYVIIQKRKKDDENIIMLKILKQPSNIYNIELDSKKVNFLIFK